MKISKENLDDYKINVKQKISALWIAILFVFAYVDIFAYFRQDILEQINKGEIAGFEINQAFLLFTTIYVVIPSLMVFLSLIMKPTLNRAVNIVLAILYTLTIIPNAIGEWNYYILGSIIEVALLTVIIYYSIKWPRSSQ